MNVIVGHLTKTMVGGVVALLPIAGTVITVVYIETTLAGAWIGQQPWYFPGLGIIAACVLIYLIGLTVTTFLGNWLWGMFDRLLDNLPALGTLYKTLKQVLGYGEGTGALFEHVVLVPSYGTDSVEIGLVTNDLVNDRGERVLTVFVPGSPTPTSGRLLMIEASKVHRVSMPVNEALKALVSVGKTSVTEETLRQGKDLSRANEAVVQPPPP